MLEYLQKFKNLPPEIRSSISSVTKTKVVEELEAKYGIGLASFIMRVTVKEIYFNNIAANLMKEFGLEPAKATKLDEELQEKVFKDILRYLKPSMPILEQKKPKKSASKIDLSHLLTPEKPEKKETQIESGDKKSKINLSHLFQADNKNNQQKKQEINEEAFSAKKESETKTALIERIKTDIVKKAPNSVVKIQKIIQAKKKPEEKIEVDKQKKEEPSVDLSLVKPKQTKIKEEIKPVDILSEEDKKEIRRMVDKTKETKKEPSKNRSLEDRVQEVIKEAKINFGSQELSRRFQNIINSYLRGVRSKIDARDFLTKDTLKGGLELNQVTADKVLKIANSQIDGGILEPAKVSVKTRDDGTAFIFDRNKKELLKSKTVSREVEYDLATALKKVGQLKESPVKGKSILPLSSDKLVKENKIIQESKKSGQSFKKGAVLGEGKENSEEKVVSEIRSANRSSKKRMDDIKPASRIVGPVDELRYMDLITFRRLGANSADRTAKIKEKIDLMSKEGIERRLEAIDGWRQSRVNRNYLSVGKQSISQGKSVDEIIKFLKDEGKEVVEKDEFEVIMDLNEELRY